MGKFFLTVALSLSIFISTAQAQDFFKPKVAIVNFGLHGGAITSDLNVEKVGTMCTEYIKDAMNDSGKFVVMSDEIFTQKLAAENLTAVGIIPPEMICKIGEILGADYVIIGSVFGVGNDQCILEVVSNGAKINSVEACIIARMVEVKTGKIFAVAEGRGESKSSRVKAGDEKFGYITVGTKKIPQGSVHNSIKKAAFSLVDDFIKYFPEGGSRH